jgi:hypothetical protein
MPNSETKQAAILTKRYSRCKLRVREQFSEETLNSTLNKLLIGK